MTEPLYEGRVGLKVADTVRGAWALPAYEHVSVGRLPGAGIHIPDSWVPSRLCRFLPYEQGWLVQLGRARATVSSKFLDGVTFRARTIVALQPGQSLIAFPVAENAVRIEREMHQRFSERRVNRVNNRKEFFKVTPAEARDALAELSGELMTFVEDPEALEYRQGLSSEAERLVVG